MKKQIIFFTVLIFTAGCWEDNTQREQLVIQDLSKAHKVVYSPPQGTVNLTLTITGETDCRSTLSVNLVKESGKFQQRSIDLGVGKIDTTLLMDWYDQQIELSYMPVTEADCENGSLKVESLFYHTSERGAN